MNMRINTSQGHGLNDEELCSKSKCPTHKFASERNILKVLGMEIRMQFFRSIRCIMYCYTLVNSKGL